MRWEIRRCSGSCAAEHEIGRLLLQIDRRAVRAEKHPFADTDARAREFDAFGTGSLREQKDLGAGTRTIDSLLDKTFGRGGENHCSRRRAVP